MTPAAAIAHNDQALAAYWAELRRTYWNDKEGTRRLLHTVADSARLILAHEREGAPRAAAQLAMVGLALATEKIYEWDQEWEGRWGTAK
jgi:hypothetical protein